MLNRKNGYLTKRALTLEIKKVVSEKHNLNPSSFIVNWMSRWQLVKYPTGLIAKAGKIKIHAQGFNPRIFIVHQNVNQKWYMR
ncbi:MAG: hypothetical protein QQN41_04085 [Nitrosopumilus sp.]